MLDNKISKEVPAGIRYLSEWEEFKLINFPGHCILHKQLPGCGFTEFALTSPDDVVLGSPRRMLMENKKDQHGDDVYLVVNENEVDQEVDTEISNTNSRNSSFLKKLQKQTGDYESNVYTRLFHEIYEYIGRMRSQSKPVKIIVTYDSTYLVKQILTQIGIIDNFYFCVDEFQSILEDSRFKSSVELDFLYVLQDIKHVLYVSATPMIDKYLSMIPELANIPYYILDWRAQNSSRVKKANLKIRGMSSVGSKMTEIIKTYLDGNFEKAIVERDGQLVEVESREAVFYVNSVNHIISIIKKMGLRPDQVNILCSKTPDNEKKIWNKLGKKSGFGIGRVPLRDEIHKMLTFCTRTVYLGADFYSRCARSFVFSDSNTDCLSVDISMDLYQILGRQRLVDNPWHNSAEFYYRTTCDWRKKTKEDFDSFIERKLKKTNDLLEIYSITPEEKKLSLAETYQYVAKNNKYKDDYVAVNMKNLQNPTPVFNNLVLINEQRTFDIQQYDYADRFSVFSSIDREFSIEGEDKEIKDFFDYYDKLSQYVDKIHFIVDYLLEFPDMTSLIISNLSDSDKIKQQLMVLGAERIKSLGYNLTRINRDMGIIIFDIDSLLVEIYNSFQVGQRYTKKYIKERLGEIYKSADFKGTSKASDIENWFEIKSIQISINGKRENGFEIIKQK